MSSFSALQRAENSSTVCNRRVTATPAAMFQCSSASRKFLNLQPVRWGACSGDVSVLFSEPKIPQRHEFPVRGHQAARFSALQRAENSSTYLSLRSGLSSRRFQCSSASRKFLNRAVWLTAAGGDDCFSALQRAENSSMNFSSSSTTIRHRFSALQRAENSSTSTPTAHPVRVREFQCSSASRKFLNLCYERRIRHLSDVSVLFSEPKIPQL